MAACKIEAQKNKWCVSIAIVDDAGALLQFERLDGAKGSSATTALGKAQTSAALGIPSKLMADMASTMPGILKLPAGIPLQGGVPLICEGECVGAVGVSGVQASEDEQVASAGAATIA
jgi:glc operon protein GlcG